ncbi:hypothetical protein C4D60_Mb02t06380 [Musa balbisiana]|uniref:Uncharacterized protein n=1 Tax=Musa balbisiana TaxID=52838 RepID=A0A4S8I8N7_MUSBA|nr:hypothetical protein C4D60_Mb02t06380 [Musa balbisiana]
MYALQLAMGNNFPMTIDTADLVHHAHAKSARELLSHVESEPIQGGALSPSSISESSGRCRMASFRAYWATVI